MLNRAETRRAFDRGYGHRSITHDRTNPYPRTPKEVSRNHDAWERGWEKADRELRLSRSPLAELQHLGQEMES